MSDIIPEKGNLAFAEQYELVQHIPYDQDGLLVVVSAGEMNRYTVYASALGSIMLGNIEFQADTSTIRRSGRSISMEGVASDNERMQNTRVEAIMPRTGKIISALRRAMGKEPQAHVNFTFDNKAYSWRKDED